MKISSASKKILASALSAAMVVAFAPTVAFGAIADDTKVKVSFDENGGSYNTSGKLADVTKTVTDGKITFDADEVAGTAYTKGSSAFDFWFYDANNNNKFDSSTDLQVSGDTHELTVSGDQIAQATAITLKASYKELKAEVTSCDFNSAKWNYDATAKSTIKIEATNLTEGTAYRAVATVGGTQYQSDVVTVAKQAEEFTIQVPNSKFAAGDIATYVETDDTRTKVIGTDATTSIYTLTYKPGDYGVFQDGSAVKTYLAAKDIATTDLDPVDPVDGAYRFAGYALEDGTTTPETVTKDLSFVAQYNNPKVSDLSFQFTTLAGTYDLFYNLENLPSLDNLESWKVTILAGSTELTSFKYDNENHLEFGADYTTNETTTAAAAAGTYTVKVEAQYEEGTTGNDPIAFENSLTVDEIVFDANGGTVDPDYKGNPPVTLIQAGTTLNSIGFRVDYPFGYINEDTTKSFAGWSVDGTTAIADTSKVVAPADGSAITLKALWNVTKAATPTLASAIKADNGTYTLTFACATDGAKLTYLINDEKGGTVPTTGLTGIAASDKVQVTASADKLTSATQTFYGYDYQNHNDDSYDENSVLKWFDKFAEVVLASATADEQTPKPVYYNSVEAVKAASEAGSAAIKTQGFATAAQWEKLVVEQETGVIKAVISYATTQIEALRTLTKSADGKTYSLLSDTDYKKTIKALDALVEAFEKMKNFSPVEFLEYMAYCSNDGNVLYVNLANSIVRWAKNAAANNTFDAADVEAAQAVTASLQAAKDATAAAAAIEAYNALTDAQKKFVATADVAAAQKVVIDAKDAEAEQAKKDAEQAKKDAEQKAAEDAQTIATKKDEKAVQYCNSTKKKVVKLTKKAKKAKKTAKKASVKWNSLVSESGNAVTYAKASGSSKITISANGVATLKKGVKKGKYVAKVKVTCGNATRIVIAKFIVR